jgi:hydrogenase maturation protease
MSSSATIDDAPATLVVGLGNPILGDDGVGWRIVDSLERRLAADADARRSTGRVDLDRLSEGGLNLMERLVGYDRVVITDSVLGSDRPGTVTSRPLTAVISRLAGHLDSAHDAPLTEALAVGRALGAPLPSAITVVGVAVRCVDVFGERLSSAVEGAVDRAVDAILAEIGRPDGTG